MASLPLHSLISVSIFQGSWSFTYLDSNPSQSPSPPNRNIFDYRHVPLFCFHIHWVIFFQKKQAKPLQTSSNPMTQLQCQKHASNPHMNLVVPLQKIHPTITSPFGFAGVGLTPSSSSYAAALPAGPRDRRRPWPRWWPREAKWHSCCMGCRPSGKLRMDWYVDVPKKMGENFVMKQTIC